MSICHTISSDPSVPHDLTVSAISPTSINVTWSAPADANGSLSLLQYNVYLETEIGGQLELLNTHEVTASPEMNLYSVSFIDLMAFTLYRVQVSAATELGVGANTTAFVTTDPDSASPPSFVLAKTFNPTVIQVSWGYPEIPRGNITGYIIYHNVTSEGQLNVTLSFMNDMKNQTYGFMHLIPFTYYEFSVAAFAETAIQIHYGIPSDPPVVARTDEDSKILCDIILSLYNTHIHKKIQWVWWTRE